MESRYVPGWYSLLAQLGILIGISMIFFGLVVLTFAYLPTVVIARYIGKEIPELVAQVPLWGGVVMVFLGVVCYAWGYGLLHFHDWAPLLAAVFVLEVGLYIALFLYLAYLGKIPGVKPLAEVMQAMGISERAKWALLLFPVTALFLIDLGLIRSKGVVTLYARKYEGWPPSLPICSNIQCRIVLPESEASCPRCQPQYIYARLVPLTGGHAIDLKFAPGREWVRLSRLVPDEPPEEQTVYFDVNYDELYSGISVPHAMIIYDGEGGYFLIEDLDSLNGTYVDGRKLPPREPTMLPHMSEVKLGAAAFRFEIEIGEEETREVSHS